MEIKALQLKKNYKDHTVLHIPELTIPGGQIFGLLGNNGAGKTTFLRLALDLIKADEGYVTMGTNKVNESEEWKKYTGSFLDQSFLLDFMKPEEYFYFLGELYDIRKQEIEDKIHRIQQFFGGEVVGLKGKLIRSLSTGNKQKCGIAGALFVNPKVVILDEPFNSLDPSSQILLKLLLKDMNQKYGTTIIVSSHDLNHVSELCQRVVILEKGLIVKDMEANENTLEELKSYFYQSISL
ncbi:MAG: ABC transporter ATP-binding protein [Cytophagales bacterium]|nr:ABC transporter ATP-binding protein [Cytophagales bacterium]